MEKVLLPRLNLRKKAIKRNRATIRRTKLIRRRRKGTVIFFIRKGITSKIVLKRKGLIRYKKCLIERLQLL